MALIVDYPLISSLSGVNTVQAMGSVVSGDSIPSGIAGALYFENGCLVATVRDSDPETALGLRSEITAPADPVGERWYCFDFMIPESWDVTKPMSIMQIHDTPDGGDGGKWPNFAVTVENGQIVCSVPNGALPTEVGTGFKNGGIRLQNGKWYSGCLHVNWQTTAIGFREFFIDRVPLFRQFNVATHYVDAVGPYLKIGVYDFYHLGGFGTQSARFRNVKVWSGNDGYQTVMGGPPLPKPQIQIF